MSRLAEGSLVRRPDSVRMPFEIHLLSPGHLDEVEAVQAAVVETLPDRSFYYPLSRDILALSLGERGLTAGTFVDGRLVGFRSILFPRPGDENLGEDLGLPDSELRKVAHLERTAIRDEYRGNALQRRMTSHIIRLAGDATRWRHLFSTVAPLNYPSMRDKFACGMLICRLSIKYEGCWRYVFYQDVLDPIRVDPDRLLNVDGPDVRGQVEALKNGYLGYDLTMGPDGMRVVFGKSLPGGGRSAGPPPDLSASEPPSTRYLDGATR